VTWGGRDRDGEAGVAHYDVTVDGGAAVRFGADLTQEPIVVGRALPGQHTVQSGRGRPGPATAAVAALRRIETQ